MKLASTSVTSKIRTLNARRLRPDRYLREVTKLADLDIAIVEDGSIERTMELRSRIAVLEARVRELEAHK